MSGAKPSVVLGTIGSDAHVVGVTLLEHALKEAGFEVRNLGAQVSRERFRAMGFDAVFGPTAGFEEAVAALRDHLGLDEHATATEPERARVR